MTDTFSPTFAESATPTTPGSDRRAGERMSSSPKHDETPKDRSDSFASVVLAVRWSATVATVIVGAEAFLIPRLDLLLWIAAMTLNTMVRTISPLEYRGSRSDRVNLALEIALVTLAIVFTGGWQSPLVFFAVTVVIVAGFAGGSAFGARAAAAFALVISIPGLIGQSWSWSQVSLSLRWGAILVLVGLIAGYSRRISGEASRQQSLTLDRLNRLSDANALLFNLHRIAQTMPTSLNYDEVLDSTIVRLRGLIDFESAAVLVIDESDGSWIVARRQSMRIGQLLTHAELCPPAQRAADFIRVEAWDSSESGPGFSPRSASGLYCPLRARGSLIGLLCVESQDEHHFSSHDQQILEGFSEPVALAIDNARWFTRLRTVGADEERTRIARELHDRVGQSLAYLGFELDRIIRHDENEQPVGAELAQLRTDLRGATTEVREALYDLRTDVASAKDFVATLEEFSARVADRAQLDIDLDCVAEERLPILREREMWRITQEALINVERHAEATAVTVRWHCANSRAVLEIIDNGKGFKVGKSGRQDSYGILGMRERASSIGASLELDSNPGEGTKLRCTLEQG